MTALYIFQSHEFDINKTKLTELQKNNLSVVGDISGLSILMAKNQNELRDYLDSMHSNQSIAVMEKQQITLDNLNKIEASFNNLMQRDFKNPMQPFIIELFEAYISAVRETITLAATTPKQAEQKLLIVNKSLGEINHLLTGLSNHFITQLTIKSVQLNKSSFNTWVPLIILLTIGITIILGLMISSRMSLDLTMYTNALKQLSQGNHEVETPASNDPYFLDLEKSVYSFKQVLKKNQQQKVSLEQSHHRYETLLNFVPTAIIAINNEQKITLFNNAAETMFGFKKGDIEGYAISILIPEIENSLSTQLVKNSQVVGESLISHNAIRPFDAYDKTGEHFLIEIDQATLQVSSEELTTFAITDVTARYQSAEKIWKQANYDSLTGLPNRLFSINSLKNTLQLAKRHQQKVAVIFIDLDGFKKINDTLGHPAGDSLLVKASEKLLSTVRSSDLVGRLGGDEFVIILSELSTDEDVDRTIENLLQEFRKPILIEEQEVCTTLSIGVSFYPQDANNSDELLKNADIAMYHAKKKGRNNFAVYQDDMRERIHRRILIEKQLNNALENNEFFVYYQAQHDSKTQKIIGVEALIRWENPELGRVTPNEFIPIAEQTGHIVKIGQYVIKKVARQLKQWHEVFPSCPITASVNLSPVQLRDPQLIDKINQALYENSLPAKYLNLEITEGVLLTDNSGITELLKKIKQRGLTISIDDFGTGYSSLSYLHQFAFDSLKIDRSFIKNSVVKQSDQHLIKAIIAMAHALKMTIVVEGVETKEQYEFIVNNNADYIQGFYFGKPSSAKKFTKLLENNVPKNRVLPS